MYLQCGGRTGFWWFPPIFLSVAYGPALAFQHLDIPGSSGSESLSGVCIFCLWATDKPNPIFGSEKPARQITEHLAGQSPTKFLAGRYSTESSHPRGWGVKEEWYSHGCIYNWGTEPHWVTERKVWKGLCCCHTPSHGLLPLSRSCGAHL